MMCCHLHNTQPATSFDVMFVSYLFVMFCPVLSCDVLLSRVLQINQYDSLEIERVVLLLRDGMSDIVCWCSYSL
jgi:hypothetical protein